MVDSTINREEVEVLGQLLFDLLESVQKAESANQHKVQESLHNALLRIHEEEKSQKKTEEEEMKHLLDAMG
jgi:hypothetical protein